ncbi:GGDEF domain-containing protein [Salinicola avicenniae]|uniref:GGDEF domain-containing protein n=1 Tax=Salinicola avicenniae TaxID=2916836 RepID=UPI002074A6D7|nr:MULTISPECIES: diguanylate cyclase [unclassified Salinicola]
MWTLLFSSSRQAWRRLTQPPDQLAAERRRSFEIMAEIFLLASIVQLAAAPVIYLSGHVGLGHANLLCVVGYAVALILHRRLFVAVALALKMGFFLSFVTYGVVISASGSTLIYYLLFAEVELMLSDLRRRAKILATVALIALSLAVIHTPFAHYVAGSTSGVDTLLSDLGLVLIFVMLCIVITRALTITDRHEHRYRLDATHDSLTLVLNRRAIFERASACWKSGRSFVVLLLDADHFKEVNDNHGHTAGDAVLHHLAGILRDALRDDDHIGRVGGEEFLILLPDVGQEETRKVAARIREHLAAHPCQFDGLSLPVTLSMGFARSREGRQLRDVIELADRRLYAAKSNGRNQVVGEGHTRSESSLNAARLAQGAERALNTDLY